MARKLSREDAQTAVAGACVLASGGGGSYQVARQIVEQGITENDQINVSGLLELESDGWLTASANMGAPDALFKTTNPHAPTNALRAMEAELKMMASVDPRFQGFSDFRYVLPIEVGAINTASPLAVAAQIRRYRPDFAVIDADGAGRSIPTLNLTTFAANGITVAPAVVASEGLNPGASEQPLQGHAELTRYNSGVIRVSDEMAAEDAIIGLVMSAPFGGIAGLAMYPMTAATLKQSAPPVPGTLSLALQIGTILEQSTGLDRAQQVAACVRETGRAADIIFHGRVTKVVQAQGGVDVGRIELEAADGSGVIFTVYDENENAYAMRSDRDTPVVTGPDSICYITAGHDPLAIDNSDLNRLYSEQPETRLELFIMAIQAAPQMRNTVIIDNFAAVNRSLGYGGAYRPWPGTDKA